MGLQESTTFLQSYTQASPLSSAIFLHLWEVGPKEKRPFKHFWDKSILTQHCNGSLMDSISQHSLLFTGWTSWTDPLWVSWPLPVSYHPERLITGLWPVSYDSIPTKSPPLPVGHCLGITLCALSLLLRRLIRRYCQFQSEKERTRKARDSPSKRKRSVFKWKEKESERHPDTMFFTWELVVHIWTSLGPGLA